MMIRYFKALFLTNKHLFGKMGVVNAHPYQTFGLPIFSIMRWKNVTFTPATFTSIHRERLLLPSIQGALMGKLLLKCQ